MKSKTSILVALIVAALVATVTVGALPSSTSKTAFEYQVIERGARSPEELLNGAGREGWELVAVTVTPDLNTTYYLKRELR